MSSTRDTGGGGDSRHFYGEVPSPFLLDWDALGENEQKRYERWFKANVSENVSRLERLVRQEVPGWVADFSMGSLEPLGEWLERSARVRPYDNAVDARRASTCTFAFIAIQLEDAQGAKIVMTDETLLAVSLAAVYTGETYRRLLAAKGCSARWQRAKRRSRVGFGQITVWGRSETMSGETDWGDVLIWSLRYFIEDGSRRLSLESSVTGAVDLFLD